MIMNEIVNGYSIYLNKERNNTLENNIENDLFVVVIHPKNEVNANEENLS